jgi:hypothetical protein
LAYSAELDALDPSGKGAMLLPIPSSVPLTEDNFIDTSEFPWFLDDIINATKVVMRTLGEPMSFRMSKALVIDRGDVTYVYAESFAAAWGAVSEVTEARRPTFTQEFIDGCTALYNEPIAIACWAGSAKMQPLMIWYVPSDPTTFRLPTMDSHDGSAPRRGEVDTDHNLSVSADSMGREVKYSGVIPDNVKSLLSTRVHGAKFEGMLENGDCFVDVADADAKRFAHIIRRWSSKDDLLFYDRMVGWS